MLVLVAIMLVMIIGMAAFAVDVGFIVTSKTSLQSAADAAALAGATTLVENYTAAQTQQLAMNYAQMNAPGAHATITLGIWDPDANSFTADNSEPNAVRAVVARTTERGNALPSFFSRLFGHQHSDITTEAIAVGAIPQFESSGSSGSNSVYVTSTKDLSNVVLQFEYGEHQKFEPLSGYSGTFAGTGEHAAKVITGVWIKSGCYTSGDGPGYGEYVADPEDGTTAHGLVKNKGCNAHVTATFAASGVTFTESGLASPLRLVK
jgi:Flp pilus assembly protein TadG